MKDIRISDIANLAGVSLATVSRVINTPEKVADSTRERILKIMADNNYVYNAIAGGLANKNTNTIGLIIPTITNPIFALSTDGVQTVAAKRKFSVLLGSTEYTSSREYDLIRLFSEKQVDGIIITGNPLHLESVTYMRKRRIPFIMIWEKTSEMNVSYVTFDNVLAARRVVDYFRLMGHRRISFISGDFESSGRAKRRWLGYKRSLQDGNIPYDDSLVIHTEFSVSGGREAAHNLFNLDNPPTAIFCVTDILAYGAMAAAQDIGLKVGRDISIIGFDDLEMSSAWNPPLTSMRIPALQMGEIAANALIDFVTGKNRTVIQKVLNTELSIRKSVSSVSSM